MCSWFTVTTSKHSFWIIIFTIYSVYNDNIVAIVFCELTWIFILFLKQFLMVSIIVSCLQNFFCRRVPKMLCIPLQKYIIEPAKVEHCWTYIGYYYFSTDIKDFKSVDHINLIRHNAASKLICTCKLMCCPSVYHSHHISQYSLPLLWWTLWWQREADKFLYMHVRLFGVQNWGCRNF